MTMISKVYEKKFLRNIFNLFHKNIYIYNFNCFMLCVWMVGRSKDIKSECLFLTIQDVVLSTFGY